jgi:hypothetical protein
MPATIITDRVLVTDHSHWEVMLKPQELIDGGVTDVILKAGSGMGVDSNFQKNGENVAKYSKYLRLHAYWWDDPIAGGNAEANFVVQTLKKSGLPILSLWADLEQWWSDWNNGSPAGETALEPGADVSTLGFGQPLQGFRRSPGKVMADHGNLFGAGVYFILCSFDENLVGQL